MPTAQEREQFLSDVSCAAGLPVVVWNADLEAMAQVAATARYPPDEAPVWARDSELAAAHLARRRATMDEWDYRNIIYELGQLLATDREGSVHAPVGDAKKALCDDACSDAASDQLSSRASEVSELSEVFETVDEQLVGAEMVEHKRCSLSLDDLQTLSTAGKLRHLIVNDALAQVVCDMSHEEALAFLGLDCQPDAAS